jgi:hypothetical protein
VKMILVTMLAVFGCVDGQGGSSECGPPPALPDSAQDSGHIPPRVCFEQTEWQSRMDWAAAVDSWSRCVCSRSPGACSGPSIFEAGR